MKHAPFCSDRSSHGEKKCACGKNRICSSCGWGTGVEHECDPESDKDAAKHKEYLESHKA